MTVCHSCEDPIVNSSLADGGGNGLCPGCFEDWYTEVHGSSVKRRRPKRIRINPRLKRLAQTLKRRKT